MNNFLDTILTPFTYVVSWVLWAFHELFTTIGMNADSGVTWTLSIIFLVLLIRTLLIPVFVKQIKSQRAMQALQPDLRKLQAKQGQDRPDVASGYGSGTAGAVQEA